MATAVEQSSNEIERAERWQRALVGPLPNDFLRLTTSRDIQEQADRQAALALHQLQFVSPAYMAPNIVGRLSITVAQAKLVKNYGMTRMDPYVRLRVGHYVYETQTDPNGGKMPRWNRVIHCQLPAGVNTIFLEIYDECNFTMDELIAYAEIKIPDAVLRGETHEEWYPLSGKQGTDLEGMVDLVFSFSRVADQQYIYQAPQIRTNMSMGRALPVFVAPAPHQGVPQPMHQTIPGQTSPEHHHHLQQQQQQQQQPIPQQPAPINEEDLKQIQEMFPNLDKEVIKSVFIANNGNKDTTINSLLQMTN